MSDPAAEERPAEPGARSEATVKRDRRVELLAAILLSAATVVTAWSAYQATRWSGDQAASYTTASAKRTESVRASTLVNRQILIAVSTFLDWVDATADGDDFVLAAVLLASVLFFAGLAGTFDSLRPGLLAEPWRGHVPRGDRDRAHASAERRLLARRGGW